MDLTQIVIIVCLLAVSTVLVICGIYLIQIFKELKNTIAKTGSILDDTHQITKSVAGPVTSASEFVMGFKNGFSIFNQFFKKEK